MESDTKKEVKMKNDGKEFERFDDFVRQIVSVPKEELKRREEAEKKRKEKKRL